MAKSREEMKRILTPVISIRNPVTHIQPTFTPLHTPTCGCGRTAEYLVYEDEQPHCSICLSEAIDTKVPVLVRKVGGWYDDAS